MTSHEDEIQGEIHQLFQLANLASLYQQASTHFQQGHIEKAEELLNRILANKPNHADAIDLLGSIAAQRGLYEKAAELAVRAIESTPDNSLYYFNHGLALNNLGHPAEALLEFERATQLNPQFANAHYNRGCVLNDLDRLEEALACYDRAIQLTPQFAEAHYNRGCILSNLGRLDEALEACARAIQIYPQYYKAHNNRGNALKGLGRLEDAREAYEQAVQINPAFALGQCNLGHLHRQQGNNDQALACYQKALSLDPDYAEARWAFAMAQIPTHYGKDYDFLMCRARFSRELSALTQWFSDNVIETGYEAVGTQTLFYLAYQEENNRDLLSRYGALCVQLMKNWMDQQKFKATGIATYNIFRIGIVSSHIRDHSVWNAIIKGWFKHLDRERFELNVFSINSMQDHETVWAKSHSAFFAHGEKSLYQWVEAIRIIQPDVLIYPEISMDTMTAKLASLRLARVQITAWGHPETSGLPTMDYYLTAEGLEPQNAQEYYSEQIVCLPHLGCCYHPVSVVSARPDFNKLNIDLESPVFICPGTPFKYLPQHDWVFIEIARRLCRCQFVFFIDSCKFLSLSQKLYQRIETAFSQAGLSFSDYVVFIPWQKKPEFHGLMKHATVYLDTIGFSGFNTAMQAMECGLPLVTKEGRFMRGRLASGIMRRIGLQELIADNEEDYITLAIKLAQDSVYRESIRKQIEANRGILYDDVASVHALEDFLAGVLKRNE